MEAYYRNYTVFKTFLKKKDREVFLAKPFDYYEGYPEFYVVKVFNSTKEPSELIIHKQLAATYPSVLKIYDSWSDNECFFMSIEYCEGGDLHNYFESSNGKLFPFPNILIYCCQIAETVWSMHYLNICHRDIKPLNIYIKNNLENFKLGDFGEAKQVIEPEGYHTITGTPFYMSPEQKKSLNNRVGLKVNPYRDDIWALGRTFVEISLCRLCPEMYGMSIMQLHLFIEDNLRSFHYDEDFITLIKKMMPELTSFQITTEEVMRELQRIYYKSFENKDKKQEKIKDNYVYEESKDDYNQYAGYNDKKDKDLILGLSNNSELKEERPEVYKNPLKIVLSSEEKSRQTFNEFSIETKSNFDYRINNPFIEPLESKKTLSNSETELKNSPIIFKPSNSELPKSNFIIPPNIPISAKSPPILSVLNPVNQSKSLNNKKVDDIKPIFVNIEKNSEDAPKNERLSYQSPKNGSCEESNKGPTPSKHSLNSPQSEIIRNEEQKFKICSSCKKPIIRSSCEMPCKDPYHPECIKHCYQSAILKMNRRSEELTCYKCHSKIPFQFFERCTFLEPSAKLIISLQIYGKTLINCPICNLERGFFMLSKKLKARDKKCKGCKSNFCTFCGVKGGHRFNCDLLKDFKNAKVDHSEYNKN